MSVLVCGCGNEAGGGGGGPDDGEPEPGQQLELDPFSGFGVEREAGEAPGVLPDRERTELGERAPAEYAWYLLAGSIDLGALMDQFDVDFKRFDMLAGPVQTALTDVLDAARDGAYDRAFLQIDMDSGMIATGLGFVLKDSQFNWQAFGLPALEASPDPLLPISVSPDGPVVAISLDTFDALVDQVEPLITDAVSEATAGLESGMQSQFYGLIDDFDSFMSQIDADDPSDGLVSAAQVFSFTIPGPAGDMRVGANVTYDLADAGGGDRWLGGVGVDVSVTGAGGPLSFSLEMGVGQQKMTDLDVVSLEPGPGTMSEGQRLAGEWVAAVDLGALMGAGFGEFGSQGLPPTLDDELVGAESSAGKLADDAPPRRTLHRRMTYATGRVLSALTGQLSPDERVRAQNSGGDTLYVKLQFDGAGRWQDIAVATGSASQAPGDEAYTRLTEALAELEASLGLTLPDVELRTTLEDNGALRLDIIATDLIVALIQEFADLGLPGGSIMGSPQIPELSMVIIGGNLADDRIDGRIVILLFVEEVTFTRR